MANEKPPMTQLPSMAYRGWFLFIMVLVSATVVGERYMMAVMVGPIKADLGLSDTEIALAKDMAIALVYITAVIPLARLADKWSKRKIVAIAAAVWSVAVIVCGLAKSFWLLLLGRAAIGLGEGGFTPPSQSWVADLFPVRQRATALAIFLLGASLGNFLGPAVGGWLTEEYGWRHAMMVAGIPGLFLAPLVWFTLRDIPRGLSDGKLAGEVPEPSPFFATIKEIWAVKTLPFMFIAAALNSLITMGFVSWTPAFVERSHGMSPAETGLQMGLFLVIGSTLGHTIGGPLADFLSKRDLRWYIWIQVLCGIGATLVAFSMLSGPKELALPLLGLNMLIGGMSAAPLLAVVAGLAPAQSRSVAVALLMVFINVIGLGLGPTFVGWLSDMLSATAGQESLRLSMQIVLSVGIPAAICAFMASRYCLGDFERAGGWGNDTAPPASLH